MLAWFALGVALVGAASNPFIATFMTEDDGDIVTLPLNSTYSYFLTVNWGDGSPAKNYTNYSVWHNYTVAGSYNISVWGNLSGFAFGYCDSSGSLDQIISIVQWGGFIVDASSAYSFYYADNLVSVAATDSPTFTAGATLSNFFSECHYLVFANINWNTSNVVAMDSMFYDNYQLNSPITLFTPNVQDMSYMFAYDYVFNGVLTGFHTQSVTSFTSMFYEANVFNQPVPFNTSSAQDLSSMFYDANVFNQVINFDTRNVLNMNSMFYEANAFNSAITFTSVASVTDMSSMFEEANAFNQVINWNTASVTTFDSMFRDATSFNSAVTLNTSVATSLDSMFEGAKVFNQPLSFNTATVTDMDYMFDDDGCGMVFSQNLATWNTAAVTDCAGFCDYCGLPAFPLCTPCSPIIKSAQNWNVCNCPLGQVAINATNCGPGSGTSSPVTASPSKKPTSGSGTSKPTTAGSTSQPTTAGSTSKPTTAGSTSKPTTATTTTAAPTQANAKINGASSASPFWAAGLVVFVVVWG